MYSKEYTKQSALNLTSCTITWNLKYINKVHLPAELSQGDQIGETRVNWYALSL